MTKKRIYQFGKSRLILTFGNITDSHAQVLVSSDDYYLTMGGGVSRSILRAGGNAIALDASKKVPAALGDVVLTTAGNLPAQYIFHAVTIGPNPEQHLPTKIIRMVTHKCMQLLDSLHLQSIAFPAIGSGGARFNLEEVAANMSKVIADDLSKRRTPIEVTIYLFDHFRRRKPIDYVRFFEEFASRTPDFESHEVKSEDHKIDEKPSEVKEKASLTKVIDQTSEEITWRRINNLRKLLASLEDQRFKLEEQFINLSNDPDTEEEVKKLQKKLRENEELRLSYFKELKTLSEAETQETKGTPTKSHKTVFVSSTYRDLVAHRAAIKDQITRRGFLFRGMEHFGASPDNLPPAAKIVEEVRQADVYLGIFGVRYGSIDEATGLSMTELEFNEAISSEKPMLLYVIRDDAPVKVSDIEPEPEGKARLDRLKKQIMEKYMVYFFRTKEDLSRQVYEDLGKL